MTHESLRVLLVNRTDRVAFVRRLRTAIAETSSAIEIVATDEIWGSAMASVADHFEVVPPADASQEFGEWLIDIVARLGVGCVLATSNYDLPHISEKREALEAVGVRVLVPRDETIALALDKRMLYRFLRSKQVVVPELLDYCDLAGKSSEVPYPIIGKPTRGEGSVGCVVLRSSADLERCWYQGMILERRIEGVHYTVDFMNDECGIPRCIVPRRCPNRSLVVCSWAHRFEREYR